MERQGVGKLTPEAIKKKLESLGLLAAVEIFSKRPERTPFVLIRYAEPMKLTADNEIYYAGKAFSLELYTKLKDETTRDEVFSMFASLGHYIEAERTYYNETDDLEVTDFYLM